MKKYGLLIFIMTFVVGIIVSVKVSQVDSVFGKTVSFSWGKIQGSGVSKTESREISDFESLDISGALNVEVTAGSTYQVEVTADDNLLEFIKTEVKGNQLKVYSNKSFSAKTKVSVKISMPEINGLDVSGASNVDLTEVKSENFDLNVSGASKVKISGESLTVDADVSGASRIDAENFKAKTVRAEASGASNGTFSVVEKLVAEASGAANIRYVGEPQEVSKNSSGAGSVKKKE